MEGSGSFYTPHRTVKHANATAKQEAAPSEMIAGDPIVRAAKADPFGDRIHTILFVLWAFALPLGMIPWAKDVVFGGLIIWSVLRATVGHVGYAWSGVPRSPLAWLLALWLLWSSLSLTWSPNPAFGADQLGGLRMLIVPFAVWPVLRKWRMALGGFIIGGTLVAAVIVAQATGWVTSDRSHRFSASMSIWQAGMVCVTILLGHFLLVGVKPGAASVVWHVGGVTIASTALVLNATRSCWVAVIVVGIGSMLILIALTPTLRWRLFLIATAATAGLAIAATIDDAFLGSTGTKLVLRRTTPIIKQFRDSSQFVANRGTINYRRKMWNGGRNMISQRPIAGWGLGGLSTGMLQHPGLKRAWPHLDAPINHEQFNPHSSYVYQGASTGLIGLALMLGTLVVALICMGLRVRNDPVMIVPLAMLSAWIVISAFEATLLAGVGVGALVLFLMPAITRATQEPAEHLT